MIRLGLGSLLWKPGIRSGGTEKSGRMMMRDL